MIADINKQHRRAFELSEVWDRFFPSSKGRAPIEFWMVQLEDFTINTLGQAIKQLARKRLTHDMPLSEMLEYIPQISKVIAADRIRLGVEAKRLEKEITALMLEQHRNARLAQEVTGKEANV